jgi:hypothetical protein
MRVVMASAAADVVDAEVEETIPIRVTETTTKMVVTRTKATVVVEEAITRTKSPRDLKLEMVTRIESLATDPQEISTRITRTLVVINKNNNNPTEVITVAEVALTSMVTDLNVLTIKVAREATVVDLEEDVLEAREVETKTSPSQLMVVTNNDDHDSMRLETC